LRQKAYKPLGFLFLGLAILGVLLPVVPATPFLLLSAWFFARSSEKWHQRLLSSELFGPIIHNWEANHCIAYSTKVASIVMMVVMGGISVVFLVEETWIRIAGLTFMAIGCATLLRVKTCPRN
jgi:uncharacterized protein